VLIPKQGDLSQNVLISVNAWDSLSSVSGNRLAVEDRWTTG
jgi:hypothetical protein